MWAFLLSEANTRAFVVLHYSLLSLCLCYRFPVCALRLAANLDPLEITGVGTGAVRFGAWLGPYRFSATEPPRAPAPSRDKTSDGEWKIAGRLEIRMVHPQDGRQVQTASFVNSGINISALYPYPGGSPGNLV